MLFTSTALRAQLRYGISAGVSFANEKIKSPDVHASLETKAGFTAGVVLDVPLSKHFGLQPQLNFVQKGCKLENMDVQESRTINYLELPLNFLFNTGGFFMGTGLSFAWGLSGSENIQFEGGTFQDSKYPIHFGHGENDVNNFDFGINFTTGYIIKRHFLITANFTAGLTKVANTTTGDNITNDYFAIKAGYLFSTRKKHGQ
jgi:hypothetical protein